MLGPVAANARVPVGVATPYAVDAARAARAASWCWSPTDAFRAGLDSDRRPICRPSTTQNRQRYMVPEQRVLRIAAIGPEQVAGVAPTEAEIAAYYNANQATYGGRETRVISQAVVPTKAAADAIVARARGGASFAAAAAPAGLQRRGRQRRAADPRAIRRAGRRAGRRRRLRRRRGRGRRADPVGPWLARHQDRRDPRRSGQDARRRRAPKSPPS